LLSTPEIGRKLELAQLIVRNLEEDLVYELRKRAASHGRSSEEEHRQILREALRPERAKDSLKELLSAMPDLGDEADFARIDDLGRPVEL